MGHLPRFEIASDSDNEIVLRDIGPWSHYPTITNRAEEVVAMMLPVLRGRSLRYYDSDGELTELRIVDGKFDGFLFNGSGA